MGTFSWIHWVAVVVVVILVFGTKKLRNLGGDLGAAVKGFKDGVKDGSKPEEKSPDPVQQVANALSEKTTIDVDAKQKS